MGWNNDYTLLTAPIAFGDISVATGIGGPPYDLGSMIKNGRNNYNKWAKNKPIRYPTPSILTAAQRVGMASDLAVGVYYGLKMGNMGPLRDLLDLSTWFDYVGYPTGGDWPYRTLDFDGYHKTAKANFTLMSCPSSIDKGDILEEVYFKFDPSNAYGIDFSMVLTEGASSSPITTLGACYPFVLLSNGLGNGTWYKAAVMKAMYSVDNHVIRPLYQNGWHDLWTFNPAAIPQIASITSPTTIYASFFLAKSGFGIDADGNWHDVAADEYEGVCYPIPEGIRRSISVSAGVVVRSAAYSGYTVNSDSETVSFSFYFSQTTVHAQDIRIILNVVTEGSSVTQTITKTQLNIPAGSNPSPLEVNYYEDLDMLSGDSAQVEWIALTRLAGETSWTTSNGGQFTFTT